MKIFSKSIITTTVVMITSSTLALPQTNELNTVPTKPANRINGSNNSVFFSYQSPVDLSILPLKLQSSASVCKLEIVNHEFGNSYGKPYIGNYFPPVECINGGEIERVVLKFQSSVKGRQYDRFGAIYIDGSEILRTTTAEPTPLGIKWEFEKDISNYSPLFYNNRIVTMSLGNLVNNVYTGIFHVVVSIELYVNNKPTTSLKHQIIPISKGPGTEAWFTFNDSSILNYPVIIDGSSNLVRAELEIFISGHECDEFYYLNPPDDYTRPRKICLNGPYRELSVYMDSMLLGGVWPYPAIYTGGITLTLWRPISGLGSFDVPSATLNLEPYINLLKGSHSFQFMIPNATNLWLVSGNLHLWYDNTIPIGDITTYQPQVLISDNTQLPYVPPGDDGDYETSVSKTYTITTLTSQPKSPELFTFTITRLVQDTKFYHHIILKQLASISDFDVRRQTLTSVEILRWDGTSLNTTSVDLIGTTYNKMKTIANSGSYTQSSLYFLSGTTYSRDMKDEPGYDLKTNLTLYSIYNSTGGLNWGHLDQLTELKLHAAGFARSNPSMSAGDSQSKASIRHYEPLLTLGYNHHEPCYSRDVRSNHGYIDFDQTDDNCSTLNSINW